jgi:serine/threonine protein kinase
VEASARCCPQCGREPIVAREYRVRSLLGRGGMGVVLGAERTSDGQPVAVKVLWLGEGVDWKAIELFERSTRVLQELSHRALPQVRAFERDERGTLILVRDRFEGGSLGERIRRGRPRLDQQGLRHVLEELLELLTYLHGQVPPVLHRDIKPDNILFRTEDDW